VSIALLFSLFLPTDIFDKDIHIIQLFTFNFYLLFVTCRFNTINLSLFIYSNVPICIVFRVNCLKNSRILYDIENFNLSSLM